MDLHELAMGYTNICNMYCSVQSMSAHSVAWQGSKPILLKPPRNKVRCKKQEFYDSHNGNVKIICSVYVTTKDTENLLELKISSSHIVKVSDAPLIDTYTYWPMIGTVQWISSVTPAPILPDLLLHSRYSSFIIAGRGGGL